MTRSRFEELTQEACDRVLERWDSLVRDTSSRLKPLVRPLAIRNRSFHNIEAPAGDEARADEEKLVAILVIVGVRTPPTLTDQMKLLQAVALALILGLAGCETEPGSATSSQSPSPFVDIGDYSFWLECTGQGSPTVILEAGAGNDSGTWYQVMPTISGFTRVCRYDRAGLGNSEARRDAGTVTATRVVGELHTLLGAAHIEPSYVLIGHSYGGGLVRLYAAAHRVDVEAIVLEDSISEDQVCDRILKLHPRCGVLVDGANRVDLRAMASELRASGTLGQLPLVVLSHGVPFEIPELDRRENRTLDHLWASYQAGLARLSTDSLHVVATGSDHYIHEAQPALFVEAVRLAVQAARGHPFPACQQVFTNLDGECLS